LALFTGVSRKIGIGAAIALELARDGIDIFYPTIVHKITNLGLLANPMNRKI
jgi:hypothetical protein